MYFIALQNFVNILEEEFMERIYKAQKCPRVIFTVRDFAFNVKAYLFM